MNEILNCVTSNPTSIITVVTSVVTVMGVLAAAFPGLGTNPYWNMVRKLIDLLALNIGNAKNMPKEIK